MTAYEMRISEWSSDVCSSDLRPAVPPPGHRVGGTEAAFAGAAPGAGSVTASFLGDDYREIRDLTVDFDGFKAVQGVDLTFMEGRLHFLIGPNGAGKTTLVDALPGLSPDRKSTRLHYSH